MPRSRPATRPAVAAAMAAALAAAPRPASARPHPAGGPPAHVRSRAAAVPLGAPSGAPSAADCHAGLDVASVWTPGGAAAEAGAAWGAEPMLRMLVALFPAPAAGARWTEPAPGAAAAAWTVTLRGGRLTALLGEPEAVLPRCRDGRTFAALAGLPVHTPPDEATLAAARLRAAGLRVVAVATRLTPEGDAPAPGADPGADFALLGLAGLRAADA